MANSGRLLQVWFLFFVTAGICRAQFYDSFDHNKIEGWFFFTGDGNATMDFTGNNGYATIKIDATKDKHNVYWTLIKRNVTEYLDLEKLRNPDCQLRVEARVRVHIAPRRVNFMVNTQRTTNFHIDLMEFDIPDTGVWHTISMTTNKFDAVPGDTVYVQLCATDFGIGKYEVDVDYYRADIVNVKTAGPDKGILVPYHPSVPEISSFSNHLAISHDGLINSDFPGVNFSDWNVAETEGNTRVLTINGSQWAILRWDFEKYKNQKVEGSGILELTTQSFFKGGDYSRSFGQDLGMEFGKIRVIEILGGDPEWDQSKVTYDNLLMNNKPSDVFNGQMVIDNEVSELPGGRNFITISEPVLQRLIDGGTKGLVICPLGAVDASFYASGDQKHNGPVLHFNIAK